VDERVRFLGPVPDDLLPDVYRSADLCVLPSRALEGFGLSAVEALACGTPVVVADTGGLPEAVEGLPGSVVFPAGDHVALATRLGEAFARPQSMPSAERCREHASQFSIERLVARHETIYGRLASERACASSS
jgi:glycosyltransferase involved in cell wall biosynthesis